MIIHCSNTKKSHLRACHILDHHYIELRISIKKNQLLREIKLKVKHLEREREREGEGERLDGKYKVFY